MAEIRSESAIAFHRVRPSPEYSVPAKSISPIDGGEGMLKNRVYPELENNLERGDDGPGPRSRRRKAKLISSFP